MKNFIISVLVCFAINAAAQSYNEYGIEVDDPAILNVSAVLTEKMSMQIVKDLLNAVQTGDHKKLGELLDPDVQWSQPGNNRLSGVKRTSKKVFEMGAAMSSLSAKTVRLSDIKFVSANGNMVACLLHWNASQPAGMILDVDNIDIYTVENGKIVSVKVFSSDQEMEDRFWGK